MEETLQRSLDAKREKGKQVKIESHPAGINPAFIDTGMNQLYDQLEAETTLSRARLRSRLRKKVEPQQVSLTISEPLSQSRK